MSRLVRPVARDERSYDVRVLHQALALLGAPPPPEEVERRTAGPGTMERLRTLRDRLGLPAPTREDALVDEAAARAIEDALDRLGHLDVARSFTVAGSVTRLDGSPVRGQPLVAFDLDLPAVARYRGVRSLDEVEAHGGFEYLGRTESGAEGRYRIRFWDWQYGKAERKLADVVVYAFEGERIVGRSRLVNAQDYSDTGLARDLTVVVTAGEEGAEYERVMRQVGAFLEESRTELGRVARSSDQVRFVADELDLDPAVVERLAEAVMLAEGSEGLSHELLYGLGREGIPLGWTALLRTDDGVLGRALERAVERGIVRRHSPEDVRDFLRRLGARAARGLLDRTAADGDTTTNAFLADALPEEDQRVAFLEALGSFGGSDPSTFWTEHLPRRPEFRDAPGLVASLLLGQQLDALTGHHAPLARELRKGRGVRSIEDLVELDPGELRRMVKRAGVPAGVPGDSDEERTERYARTVEGLVSGLYPTRRVSKLVKDGALPLSGDRIAGKVGAFLAGGSGFDLARSRVRDFEAELRASAGEDAGAVGHEVMRLQRVFQLSPTPEAMAVLLKSGLDSAYAIANVPRKTFVQRWGDALGGAEVAFAVHERASHLGTRVEIAVAHVLEAAGSATPDLVMGSAEHTAAVEVLAKRVPNWAELFGSPDACACEHCRSVLGPAAYLVDLLRFLWRGAPNDLGQTPLDVLTTRRPDVVHLPLTCENSTTLVPYVDLANEVMEFYVAHGSLAGFQGHDTGDATAPELRANAQHLALDAYRILKDAPYPSGLPYHYPLDLVRTWGGHLGAGRHRVMEAMNPAPGPITARALVAEALGMSPEQYRILTGEAFDGTPDPTPLHAYFGYAAPGELDGLSAVRELLRRTGASLPDLVELLRTRFVNPHRWTLDFLEDLVGFTDLDAAALYDRLEQIEAGALDPSTDPDLTSMLGAQDAARGTAITPAELGQWVSDHLTGFREVITLWEPASRCDLDTTRVRTIRSLYEGSATSGVPDAAWSRMHRLLRLRAFPGWTLHETDVMLAALGAADLEPGSLGRLAGAARLAEELRLPPDQVAVLWGEIDARGERSLYRRLFLSKAAQPVAAAFGADPWGNVLQGGTEVLGDHRSAIRAAFRITEEQLAAIVETARVLDGGSLRPLDLAADALSLPHLSTLYRYVVLARGTKLEVRELCALVRLFGVTPFSTWDVQAEGFTGVDPDATRAFCRLVAGVRSAGFDAATLGYVFTGDLPAGSRVGLDPAAARLAGRALQEAFGAIDRDHPEVPAAPLTVEGLTAMLSLTFKPDVVARFMAIVQGTADFETTTDANLGIEVPAALADRYTYVKASGRLRARGVMTGDERTTLGALPGATPGFQSGVAALYEAPETFLTEHFAGVLGDPGDARAVLLDHPAQPTPATLEDRLAFVRGRYLPVLKDRLRRDALTSRIADLVGLDEKAAALLSAQDVGDLLDDLTPAGFTATWFSDPAWTTAVLETTEPGVDLAWGTGAPHAGVGPDAFSARWRAYLAPPARGRYTLRVDVAEPDEAFRLYLDGALLLEKAAGSAGTSLETPADLDPTALHLLTLDYVETAQDAGVRLLWKTATSALEVVPATAASPAAGLDAFVARATRYHRAATLIRGLGLEDAELDHLLRHPADFGGVDFGALTPPDWLRLRAYVELREGVPQARARLTDVFALANATAPAPTVDALTELLHRATAWEPASLGYLVTTHFGLGVDDFRNEVALGGLRDAMAIHARTGLPAAALAQWGASATDFDDLHATGQLLRTGVRAKYGEQDWLEVAGTLNDELRARRRDALVGHLLMQPELRAWGAEDADGLFEYFLIDVQMGACMDTSRVVQASAAVQMFVQRCLLNLESDQAGGVENGVSPGAIDQDRWEWMRSYRVWEANRKVFLHPENWLEPEWRHDASEFFREMVSGLTQNDITDRSVEAAFRGYAFRLDEVANLQVCGLHRENHEDGALRFLHVFARTRAAPYTLYYRRWNAYRKWSAWESVPVAVRAVEAGASSGVHLIPVTWKGRLFLFWPEFTEVKTSPTGTGSRSAKAVSEDHLSTLEAERSWEVRLAWSERVDGKWTPKRVSSELVRERPEKDVAAEKDLLFTAAVSTSTNALTITISDAYWNLHRGRFELADIRSPIKAHGSSRSRLHVPASRYAYHFTSRTDDGPLELMGDTYLERTTPHTLVPVATQKGLDLTLDDPFFFGDPSRTWFVRPVGIWIKDRILYPERYLPRVAGAGQAARHHVPAEVPDAGADDYLPVEIVPSAGLGNLRRVGLEQALAPRLASGRAVGGAPRALGVRSGAPAGTGQLMLAGATGSGLRRYAERVHRIAQPFLRRAGDYEWLLGGRADTGLEFHTFHHPCTSRYVERLDRGGVRGLLESDTALPSDGGATFEELYEPNFAHGLVQKPGDFPARTYYKENVCFDVFGANSLYNWELFFHAPLYIATRLSRNGRYEEAMEWFHHIFDPTTDEPPGPGESETSRYWKVLPFKTTAAEHLEDWFRSLAPNADPTAENAIVGEWRDHPFDPHVVARNRPLAYMKHVVVKYVENLLDWADSLFRQFTRESVYEALQLYVVAGHVLGRRPETVPRRGKIEPQSFHTLRNRWDDFSNALVELENVFPYSGEAGVAGASTGSSLLGMGSALYFCIPANDKLIQLWDRVADRLYKIRHCQDIDGVERLLALFAPPIDPGFLVQARSLGQSLGSALADLGSAPPIYRFTHLLHRANEFCADVRVLGAALLAAIEKRDAAELERLRASQETALLAAMVAVRERELLAARSHQEQLARARETATLRLRHYAALLGVEVTVPAAPTVGATLTADSPLPPDTTLPALVPDVDVSLVESGESGLKLIPKEKEELDKREAAKWITTGATALEALAGVFHLFPQLDGEGTPLGVGAGAWWGGQNLGAGTAALGRAAQGLGSFVSQEGAHAGLVASHIRREEEWTFQANVVGSEIVALDKQITAAELQVQVAGKQLDHLRQEIADAEEREAFLRDRFTNEELYHWMREQLFAVHKQGYDLAFDLALKAERAFRYETGTETTGFVPYGSWDNTRQGLLAGERLQVSLRQLERAWLDGNRRELELTKHISLALLDPVALIELRETGRCRLSLPEEIFDLDFQGHYFRRIKSIRLTIPCVVGPYGTLGCTLRLLENTVRVSTAMNSRGTYEHEHDEGLWTEDARFRTSRVPVTSMATSTAHADGGLFELDFQDPRYLPLEGAGAVCTCQLELVSDAELRQVDHRTISDVILHLSYTAREVAGTFRDSVRTWLKDHLSNAAGFADPPLLGLFSLRRDFPTEWHHFLHPPVAGAEHVLTLTPGPERFPFLAQGRDVVVSRIQVFGRCRRPGDYHLLLSYTDHADATTTSDPITLAEHERYGGLRTVSLGETDAGLDLTDLDVGGELTLRIKHHTAADYTALVVDPPEVEDLLLVVGYALG